MDFGNAVLNRSVFSQNYYTVNALFPHFVNNYKQQLKVLMLFYEIFGLFFYK